MSKATAQESVPLREDVLRGSRARDSRRGALARCYIFWFSILIPSATKTTSARGELNE